MSHYDDACKVIPGGSLTRSKAPGRFYPIGAGPHYAVRGRGAHLYTDTGDELLDMLCALGAISLGYGATPYGARRAVDDGGVYSLPSVLEARAAEMMLQHVAPWAERVKFTKTGSESTHAAYRIAKHATGRPLTMVGDWCYDDQTEVLTAGGWRLFQDVKIGDSVATLNISTGALEYQSTVAVTAQPFVGEMIEFKGSSLDLLVSPNHNILRAFTDSSRHVTWRLITAEKCVSRKSRTTCCGQRKSITVSLRIVLKCQVVGIRPRGAERDTPRRVSWRLIPRSLWSSSDTSSLRATYCIAARRSVLTRFTSARTAAQSTTAWLASSIRLGSRLGRHHARLSSHRRSCGRGSYVAVAARTTSGFRDT